LETLLIKLTNLLGKPLEDNRWKSFECHLHAEGSRGPFYLYICIRYRKIERTSFTILNSYLFIFMAPSIARGGKISAVVPMCPHIDNNEHSVQVVVSGQGLADLRGLGPIQRARRTTDHCAHPAYRPYLNQYLTDSRKGHIPHDLRRCFELHTNLLTHGEMLPGLAIEPASS
jgi:hypothetical protein